MIVALTIDGILLLILMFYILVKTKHFYRHIGTKRRTFVNWLYFGHDTVIRSRSSRSIESKRKQNVYSVRIGIITIALICAIVLEVILLDQPLPGSVKPERPAPPAMKR